MERLMTMLRSKIAGIPAWGWALVIGGTVVAYAYLTRKSEAQTAPTAPPYLDSESPADAGDIPGVPNPSESEPAITTNPAWVRYATDRLVATGEYGAIEVNNALTKALQGSTLTQQEAAIYNIAVSRFGAPPEGAPPISVEAPADTTTPVPAGKPGTPTIISVTSPGPNRILVKWSPGVNTAYVWIVDQGSASFRPDVKQRLVQTKTTSQYVTTESGRTYYIALRGYNANNQVGNQSRIVKIRSK